MKNERYYFEFPDHEYWALLSVKREYPSEDVVRKVCKHYLEYVGGESIGQIKEEASPIGISEAQALVKFAEITAKEKPGITVGEMLKEFHEKDVILIDGSLL